MSIQQNFPATRPSLNLNFSRSQKLDPRITFTRTSSATRVNSDGLIEVVPANSPRFDFDPTSGESLGLLVEEARTNSLLWSEDFTNSIWLGANPTVTSNITLSPDGTLSADKVEINPVRQSISTQPNTQFSISFFIKTNESTSNAIRVRLGFSGGVANLWWFPSNQQFGIISPTTITDVKTISYGNSWYKICFVYNVPNNIFATEFAFSGVDGDGSTTQQGHFVIWGAQLEQGSFPTSYIPTTTSTVTRTADNARIIGSNFSDFYNPSEWTLMVGARRNYAGNFLGFPNLARINDGTNNNTIGFYGASASIQFTNFGVVSGGINYTPYVAGNIPSTSPFKMIQALKKDNSTFGVDGVLTPTDTSVEMPVGVNQLIIGGDAKWGGTIQQLVYYPTALPSNQLITLTK
jgi:hypothetical protein